MTPQAKAVILARVSSKSQEDEGYSLDSQVKLLQSYCDNKGLVVAKTFKVTESASKASQRRTFKEAMKFIEDNEVKHLIIEKVDRHVRNLHDAVETHDWLLADENKQVHFVKDSLVMHKNSRSQEWLNWGIRVVMAKNYIDNLREEAMKGWAEKLAQGWLPSPPPPGYKTVTENGKRIHVPDPDTKALMQQVFKKYLSPNHSIASITKEMELMGLLTKQGRPRSKSHVQKILNNPFYIGINRHNGKEYPGAQQPIISKELFEAVQRKMHKGRPVIFAKHNPVFKGLIHCEDCGTCVTWQLQKGRYYGVCKRLNEACKQGQMLREDRIEGMVVEMLQKLVCPSQEIIDWVAAVMRSERQEDIKNREKLIASLQSQIDRLNRMDESLYDDKLAGLITQERYEAKHEQFVAEAAEIKQRLIKIDDSTGLQLEHRLVLLELSQKAAELYVRKAPEQKRLIASKLFSKMMLKQGSLSVEYTNFAQTVAEKVQETRKIMEEQ